MTIQQLKYIIEVVETGTFSSAAKNLFISQPSLTNAIKDVENEFNITLFLRNNRGATLTNEGREFVGYARGILEQEELLNERFLKKTEFKKRFTISSQHYSFVVNSFVRMIEKYGFNNYDFTLRETRTHEIIEDVKNFRSELGILYFDDSNKSVITKAIKEAELKFEPLFTADSHIFVSRNHPLCKKKMVSISDLSTYPRLSFEQGENNSIHFSEEMLSDIKVEKDIRVSDRATLFNILVGLNGYTVSSGIIDKNINGEEIISIPLAEKKTMTVILIYNPQMTVSKIAEEFIEILKENYSK